MKSPEERSAGGLERLRNNSLPLSAMERRWQPTPSGLLRPMAAFLPRGVVLGAPPFSVPLPQDRRWWLSAPGWLGWEPGRRLSGHAPDADQIEHRACQLLPAPARSPQTTGNKGPSGLLVFRTRFGPGKRTGRPAPARRGRSALRRGMAGGGAHSRPRQATWTCAKSLDMGRAEFVLGEAPRASRSARDAQRSFARLPRSFTGALGGRWAIRGVPRSRITPRATFRWGC